MYEVLAARTVLEAIELGTKEIFESSVANGEAGMAVHVRPAILPLHASHE